MLPRFGLQFVWFVSAALIGAGPIWSQQRPPTGRATATEETSSPRPYLGLRADSAGTLAARQLGVNSTSGAIILATDVAGPGDEAGLRRGDLIVEFAGKAVTNVDDLAALLAACPVGSSQTVVYLRGSTRKSVQVVIGRRTSDVRPPPPATPPTASPTASGTATPPPAADAPPQPPEGWVEREVGNLIVYLPPDWSGVPFMHSDEGCWFRGPTEAKQAIFAVVRDATKEELVGPMKVEREESLTLAGRAAVGYFGPTVEKQTTGRGLIVYPTEREADQTRLAVYCFASGERWAEYESTFRTILRHLRNRDAAP